MAEEPKVPTSLEWKEESSRGKKWRRTESSFEECLGRAVGGEIPCTRQFRRQPGRRRYCSEDSSNLI